MKLRNFDLSTKTSLITGAGGLLGIEHATALLECGSKVVLTDVHESSLHAAREVLSKRFESASIVIKRMDVTDPVNIRSVAGELWSTGSRIDILVNNAAVDSKVKAERGLGETSRLESFQLSQWNQEIAVGLTGAFLCSQIFGSAMADDGLKGVILNIASDLSVISPDQRLYRREGVLDYLQPVKPVTYSVIKTALVGLTRYLATYWANENIRCNSLSPGGVTNGQDEIFVSRLTSLVPLGRMANKDEYRSAVQFLCSEASSYMTGQNLIIDGGRSIW